MSCANYFSYRARTSMGHDQQAIHNTHCCTLTGWDGRFFIPHKKCSNLNHVKNHCLPCPESVCKRAEQAAARVEMGKAEEEMHQRPAWPCRRRPRGARRHTRPRRAGGTETDDSSTSNPN